MIDKLEDVIDITCKKIINPKIFKIFEILSTLSNLKLSKKHTTNILNVTTLIGIAYLTVISALNAWRLYLSSRESGFGFLSSCIDLSEGDFHLLKKLSVLF